MHIVVVDNHDSFTFNLVEYVRRVTGKAPTVVTNDVPWESSGVRNADAVIISPGPGNPAHPADLGLTAAVIEHFQGPILGVCLGMQAFVHASGGRVERLARPAHGVTALVEHDSSGVFAGLRSPLRVARYHSLHAVDIPDCFAVTARIAGSAAPDEDGSAVPDAGVVMGIAHKSLPRWGVQFHPESMAGQSGIELISNFIELATRFYAKQYFSVRTLGQAVDPEKVASAFKGTATCWLDTQGMTIVGSSAEIFSWDISRDGPDFFPAFAKKLAQKAAPSRVGAPIPGLDFGLGWVGYLGYELGAYATSQPLNQSPHPDAELMFLHRAVIIDPAADQTYLLAFAGDNDWGLELSDLAPSAHQLGPAVAVHSRKEYLAAIHAAQDYMAAGDSYEVCLTNRYELPPVPDMLAAFSALRSLGATPRAGYLDFPGQKLASVSPELFLSVSSNGRVVSRPIKGTRPRHVDSAVDSRLREELRGEKETAELLMVADMVRHDLSTVCDGVSSNPEFYIQSFPHVHQLMVDITGRLRAGNTALDAVKAAFPGGSMTGAPKDRTMGIIAELEGTWRGAYSGCFGFFSTTGAIDLSMTIRTLVSTAHGAYYGVGGAILALSEPLAEWEETQVKLKPLLCLEEQWN